jgi:hypothetical protein
VRRAYCVAGNEFIVRSLRLWRTTEKDKWQAR